MVFAHLLSMLPRDLSVQGKKVLGHMASLHALPQTVLVLLAPLALRLLALGRCAAACRPRRRLTMLPRVLIMRLRRSSPHSLLKHNLLHIFSRHLNPTAFPIPTMALLMPAACLHLLRHRPRDSQVHQTRLQVRDPLLHLDGQPVHHPRFDRLSRTAPAPLAVTIRARTYTALIPRPTVALQVAHLLQRRLCRRKLMLVIVTIVHRPHPLRGIVSGRTAIMRTQSRLPMMRSDKSLRNHTAVAQHLRTPCRPLKLLVTVRTQRRMHDDSTMAITLRRPPITRHRSRP